MTGYPWQTGDTLLAADLNAAIANSGGGKGYTPYNFGAKGSTATVWNDDTAALNAAFAQTSAEGGGRIYIPDIFYAAGALTVPPNVEIYGNFSTTSQEWASTVSYFQAGGSKLILGTGGISLGKSCILRNIMVISGGLPTTNPANSTAANALVAGMAANGTGVTLTGDNCLLDTVQVLGFNYGVYGHNDPAVDRQMLRNIHADCINGIWLDTGGDMCHVIGAHVWPYLTAMVSGPPGAAWLQRSGVGIYTKGNGGSIQIAQCTVFGWQTCYMADTNSVTWVQCWADGSAPNSAGFASTGACGLLQLCGCTSVANPFGVHHSPSNGAVFNIDAGCSLTAGGPGGNTPATGMAVGVLADGYGPVQCIGAYFAGGNAAFYLGPNSGPSIVIGNTFDDAGAHWDHLWNVDPAVMPLLTKHSNRVINSTRSMSEQFTGSPAQGGVAVYDTMPQFIYLNSGAQVTNLTATGSVAAISTTNISPSYRYVVAGVGTDENLWDSFVNGIYLEFRLANDAYTASNIWCQVARSGYAATAISFTAANITLNGHVGFNGTAPIAKPTVTGAKAGNAALASLLTALVGYGLVTDTTT